jgi:hypothetical protein
LLRRYGNFSASAYCHFHFYPLDRDFGHLQFKDTSYIAFKTLTNHIRNKLNSGEYSPQGLCNALLLLDRVDVHDQDHFDFVQEVVRLIGKPSRNDLLAQLISALNGLMWFPKHAVRANPEKVEDWEDLLQMASYTEMLWGPLDTVFELLYEEEVKGIQSLSWLEFEAVPRAIFVSTHLAHHTLKLSSQQIIEFLNQEPKETEFLTALMFHFEGASEEISAWLNKDLVLKILERWATSGKSYFHRIFGRYRPLRGEAFNKVSTELANEIVYEALSKEDSSSTAIIHSLEWPEDYEALGGCLGYRTDHKLQTELSDEVCNKITTRVISNFDWVSTNLTKLVFDQSLLISRFPLNASERVFQLGKAFALDISLRSDEKTWDELIKLMKKYLYATKPLFYGSTRPQYAALRLAENALLFILSSASLDDERFGSKAERIKQLYELIIDVVLFPYVRLTDKDIWDLDEASIAYSGKAVLWLIDRLLRQLISSTTKREVARELLEQWGGLATTTWPWSKNFQIVRGATI